jgi:hypothetical protein
MEPGGWACSDSLRVVPRLAARGDYVSVFWNVELDNQFTLARHGAVVREFDMMFHADPSNQVGAAGPLEQDLDWDAFLSAGLALQSRLTSTPPRDVDWFDAHAEVAVGYLG